MYHKPNEQKKWNELNIQPHRMFLGYFTNYQLAKYYII